MFAAARKALGSHSSVSATQITKDFSPRVPKVPPQALPDVYTLQELYQGLCSFPGKSLESNFCNAVILECCIYHQSRIKRTPSDVEYFQKILTSLAHFIRPGANHGRAVGEHQEDDSEVLESKQLTSATETVLSAVLILHDNAAFREVDVDPAFLLSVLAYSDAEDPWASEATEKSALKLLSIHQTQLLANIFIIDYVLIGFVRPLFSTSKPAAISLQGRKALNSISNDRSRSSEDPVSKPWKFRDVYAVTIFRWAVRNADEAMIHNNWHLFIPPLLTLVDDPTTYVRARGLHILIDLLSKTPGKFLESTGLGEVFEDAVMPTLLFLPSITPVEDSLELLKPAYTFLFQLGDVLFSTKDDRSGKLNFLDRIMRQGVLQGVFYSRDNANITQLLIEEADTLICRMGIHAVKHLKDIIPLLSDILSHPFGPSEPGLLLAAVNAIQSTILSCWPRLVEPIHHNELIKGFAICWNTVNEDIVINDQRNSELQEVKEGLKIAARTLVKSLEGRINTKQELELLVSVDPPIGELFGIDVASTDIPF